MSTIETATERKEIRVCMETILRFLPHRYPFLLIDRAFIAEPGVSGRGYKNVSINEPFFQGHFPGEPIMPGVLITESLAQLIAVIYNSVSLTGQPTDDNGPPDLRGRVGYLAAVNVKFLALVRPGDRLDLEARRTGKIGTMSQFEVKASVDGTPVLKGSISVTERG